MTVWSVFDSLFHMSEVVEYEMPYLREEIRNTEVLDLKIDLLAILCGILVVEIKGLEVHTLDVEVLCPNDFTIAFEGF